MKKLRNLCLTALIALLTAICLPAMADLPAEITLPCLGKDRVHKFVEYVKAGNVHHGRYQCTHCGLKVIPYSPREYHYGGTATCTELAVCDACKFEYGDYAHELEYHEAKAATCTEIGWNEYDTCKKCDYTTYVEIPAAGHDLDHHDAKAPTCTEIGWEAYDTCKNCAYTTYEEIPAAGHDLVHHEAKAATCTEVGWNEYDTCSRCDYTTYAEIPATGHDLEHHDAKAATCTEVGWEAYDSCKNCDYTTYVELPALGHDYQKTIVKPTCEKDGCTRFTCTRCEDTYTENPVKKLYHWFGEWTPNGDGTHSANCLRKGCKHVGKTDCQKFEFIAAENESLIFCPVCGEVENGTRLERIEKTMAVAVTEKLPAGELIARMNEEYLSLAFEYAGKITTPTGQVKIALPAELLAGKTLTRVALDGTETEVSFEVKDEEASFTLDFTADEMPVILIRMTDAE